MRPHAPLARRSHRLETSLGRARVEHQLARLHRVRKRSEGRSSPALAEREGRRVRAPRRRLGAACARRSAHRRGSLAAYVAGLWMLALRARGFERRVHGGRGLRAFRSVSRRGVRRANQGQAGYAADPVHDGPSLQLRRREHLRMPAGSMRALSEEAARLEVTLSARVRSASDRKSAPISRFFAALW